MHYVAGRLFFYDFSPVATGTVPVYNKDVKVWEVKDKRTGKHIGLWYLDPFARQGKRSVLGPVPIGVTVILTVRKMSLHPIIQIL